MTEGKGVREVGRPALTRYEAQPVSAVQWLHRDELHANQYNPNHVAPLELELLKRSILEDGWTQPVVCRTDREIVDGFHRWTVSGHADMLAVFGGYLPVVTLSDSKSMADQMLSTIRHNRARGTHGVKPMAHIVRELVDTHGLPYEEIETRAGMEEEEIERLHLHAGMPGKAGSAVKGFGKAWVPSRVAQPVE